MHSENLLECYQEHLVSETTERHCCSNLIDAMACNPAKRIAIIRAGPAGAIAIDAFAQEQAFDIIRVFERSEAPGGCW